MRAYVFTAPSIFARYVDGIDSIATGHWIIKLIRPTSCLFARREKGMFPMKGMGKTGVFVTVLVFTGATANLGYAQDAEHGKMVFKACAACHATDHTNRAGPGLEGLIGRKAGAVPGFHYSDAMKKSGLVWDAKTLDGYLESPQKVVPGNKMAYVGLKNPTDRTDLVTYLATLK